MPDTSATNDTLSAAVHGLSLQDSTTLKHKDEATLTDVSALASLPEEIQEKIFGLVAEDLESWKSLMQTSQEINRIAWPFCYRTGSVYPLESRYKEYILPQCAEPESFKGTSLMSVLATHNENLLNKVQVLHLYSDFCLQSSLGNNQSVRFPNLGILHSLCPSKKDFYKFTTEIAPKLHTVIVHSADALQEWRNWCQSEDLYGETNRLIIHWWGIVPQTELSATPHLQHNRNGETLTSLHILLQPTGEDKMLCADESQMLNFPNGSFASPVTYADLVQALAEICCSEVQSIVISGTDGVSKLFWHDQAYEREDQRLEARFDVVHNVIQATTRLYLGGKGLCEAKIDEHMLKINFTNPTEYVERLKQPDEMGGWLSSYMNRPC